MRARCISRPTIQLCMFNESDLKCSIMKMCNARKPFRNPPHRLLLAFQLARQKCNHSTSRCELSMDCQSERKINFSYQRSSNHFTYTNKMWRISPKSPLSWVKGNRDASHIALITHCFPSIRLLSRMLSSPL